MDKNKLIGSEQEISDAKKETEETKQPEENLPAYSEAFIEILKIGGPAIISMVSALFVEVVNTAFVGHLGSQAMMAGVGMANMFLNVIDLSVIFGINNTLNTLVSQSFGQGNYHMCGVYVNRSRIIVTIAQIPLMMILMNSRTIFDFIGFDDEASFYSQ